jgi:lipoate-protein ligase A
MKYIETNSCAPAINLAYEDYFLNGKYLEDDLFMLWRNDLAIVVGKFQNTLEEINSSFAEAHKIQVIRRISGGGTVYHDLGNLCFSFILRETKPEIADKTKYMRPLIGALSQMGIQAEVTRNGLSVGGKKISGNAMALHKNRLLFHGTLLFDTNLEMLAAVLKNSADGITSKGVKSVRSSVTNLKEHLAPEVDILQFKQDMKNLLFADAPVEVYTPSQQDFDAIHELVKTKYETWKWNYGSNPNARIERSRQFSGGVLEIRLDLEKGLIKTCRIKSDLEILVGISEIEKKLENVRYTFADVRNVLSGFDLEKNLGAISKDDLARWIAY